MSLYQRYYTTERFTTDVQDVHAKHIDICVNLHEFTFG